MILNGFIVKGLFDEPDVYKETNYYGINRYHSWPLELRKDKKSVALSQIADNKWFSSYELPLNTVPDREYILEYIEVCKSLSIPTKTLLISSYSNLKILKDTSGFEIVKTIGYEYCDSYLNYSPVYDEVYDSHNSYVELLPFSSLEERLNDYGVFSEEKDVIEYAKIRNSLLDKGLNLEILYKPIAIFVQEIKFNV